MRQRMNEMARAELTTKAHRQSPAPRPPTEFDRERIAQAEEKRARKAAASVRVDEIARRK